MTALIADRALGVLDELRVPYAVEPAPQDDAAGWARLDTGRPAAPLHWYLGPGETGPWSLGDLPLWAPLASAEEIARHVQGLPGDWRAEQPIADAEGRTRSWIWRSDAGGAVLPFNPDEMVRICRTEAYRSATEGAVGGPARSAARRAYYLARPLVPRRAQIAMRRRFARVQARTAFPRWPLEPALHDLEELVLGLVADAADRPVPHLAPWPDGRRWALVLTHDVEHAAGRDAIERVRAVEAQLGLRSAWNLVPERYAVADRLVRELRAHDCEIGVHGLRHDGRDLESLATLRRRLPAMREWAERWGATGFRSPATHRVWEWMPLLGFDHDSSYPDTDPYEPIAGGCCTWRPFFNEDLVELPITLPQDHTLFVILRQDESAWHEKTARLRERGGMALLITHPDYLVEDPPLEMYRRFLEPHATDPTAWHALPSEVSAWWRRRAATAIEPDGEGWRASGPAAGEARILLREPRRTAVPSPAGLEQT